MNFREIIKILSNFFVEKRVKFAVIGAFGLHAYGLSRATFDIYFVVERKFQGEVISFLESLGYETLHASTGYSNHLHPDPEMGRVDCVYVGGKTAERIFSGSKKRLLAKDLTLPVPRVEHMAAMKVFAMKSDPKREFQEMADLQFILGLPDVDKEKIKSYFQEYGMEEKYEELEEKVENF